MLVRKCWGSTCCIPTNKRFFRVGAEDSGWLIAPSAPQLVRDVAQIGGNALRLERRREHGDLPRLVVEQEDRCRVIHRVVAAAKIDALSRHAELAREALDLRRSAG